MKKSHLLLLFTLLSVVSYAQNVGIGIQTPLVPLHVNSTTSAFEVMRLQSNNNQGALLSIWNDSARKGFLGLVNNQDDFKIGTYPGPGKLQFVMETTNTAMTILPNGNVGIGTDTPSSILEVDGPITFNTYTGSGTAGALRFNALKFQYHNGFEWNDFGIGNITLITTGPGLTGGGDSGWLDLNIAANNGLTVDAVANRIQLGGNLTETTTINTGIYSMIHNLNSTGDFLIRDNGVNRFSVLDNGRTAIGSAANAGQFNVTGNSFFSDDLYLRDGSVSGVNLVRMFDSSDDGVIDVYQNGEVVNRIHGNANSYITGGNFGIGTKNPTFPLDLRGGDVAIGAFFRTDNQSIASASIMRVRGFTYLANSTFTGITVDPSVASSAPKAASLRGVYAYADGNADRKYGLYSLAGSENANVLTYGIYASWVSSNNAGTGPKYAGYFGGDIYVTGSYLPSYSSLKNNILPVQKSLDKLLKVEVKSYNYNTKKLAHMNLPKGNQTGFIAEEIKILYPELVKKAVQPEGQNGAAEIEFEAVNYVGLVPHLVKGIQEQQDIIDQQNLKIDTFNKALKAQEKKVVQLEALINKLLENEMNN